MPPPETTDYLPRGTLVLGLGTAVFGGMITSTILAVFFVPAFYVVFQQLSLRYRNHTTVPTTDSPAASELV